ncbi:hypothetical protein H0H87_006085 [Tephrocybe sp. NHM501043]|nr:hypothetical protein H0H87_006085 [Tephrocybe sp. NHM501043]
MSMQRPTLQNVRIRSVRDALQVFHGVATKRLPLITRRLDAEERRAIGSGNEFLFYNQKDPNFGEDIVNPVTPWAQMRRRREQPTMHVSGYMTIQPEHLVKQTYSVHVTLSSDSPRGIVRKWHLTAYFSQQRLDELGTIDGIRGVGDVPVPEGLFKSARAGKLRRDHRSAEKNTVQSSDQSSLSQSGLHFNHGHSTFSGHRGSPPQTYPTLSSPFSDDSRESSPSSESSRRAWSPSQQTSLVPLEYLQNVSGPRRDPADEQLLRRFSPQAMGPAF